MKDQELEKFEATLQRLKPAKPPAALLARLTAVRETSSSSKTAVHRSAGSHSGGWFHVLRWLLPASAAAAIMVVALRQSPKPPTVTVDKTKSDPSGLRADDVQFEQNLVASFDAVAQMPNGDPVRFRCREWSDGMTLRDSSRGIVVEQRTPRLEVTPISFETY